MVAATAIVLMASTRITAAADDGPATARFLIVSGPSTHPPGTHESAAGARLLAHLIETAPALRPAKVEVVSAWPDDPKVLDALACVIFVGDLFPGETLADPARIKADIQTLADRGVGLVCLHYATGLHAEHVTPDGDHPLLRWTGGYFASGCAHHKSTARVVTTTLEPAGGDHPIMRGWSAVKLEDEPYWNNYFGPAGMAKNVTALVTAMVPPEDPKREVVGWAIERPRRPALLPQLARRRPPHPDPQHSHMVGETRDPARWRENAEARPGRLRRERHRAGPAQSEGEGRVRRHGQTLKARPTGRPA
jgi:hypothetical protein